MFSAAGYRGRIVKMSSSDPKRPQSAIMYRIVSRGAALLSWCHSGIFRKTTRLFNEWIEATFYPIVECCASSYNPTTTSTHARSLSASDHSESCRKRINVFAGECIPKPILFGNRISDCLTLYTHTHTHISTRLSSTTEWMLRGFFNIPDSTLYVQCYREKLSALTVHWITILPWCFYCRNPFNEMFLRFLWYN